MSVNEKKNMKTALFLFMALSIFSCKNDKKAEPKLHAENYTSTLNDQAWNGLMEIQRNDQDDSLTFLAIVQPGNEEVLFMRIKFDGVGSYSLNKGQASYYSTVGRDVIVSRYALAPHVTGQLTITNYDAYHKQVEGTFDISLVKNYSNGDKKPDTLRFRNGLFKGKLKN